MPEIPRSAWVPGSLDPAHCLRGPQRGSLSSPVSRTSRSPANACWVLAPHCPASVRASLLLQVAFSAPAPQSPAQFTQSGSDVTDSAERGRGAGALASAHLEPPLVPSLDFRHAPTLADLGTCLGKEWGGELQE